MGSFVSIRGWVECDPDVAPTVADAIRDTSAAGRADPPAELAAEYLGGWRFPDRTFNWTAYIFFGADVRAQYVDWLHESVVRAARADRECEGWFRLDGDHVCCWWRVRDGTVVRCAARTLPGANHPEESEGRPP